MSPRDARLRLGDMLEIRQYNGELAAKSE